MGHGSEQEAEEAGPQAAAAAGGMAAAARCREGDAGARQSGRHGTSADL